MLDIKFIRENKDVVKQNCQNRGVKADVDRLLELDEIRRKNLKQIEDSRAERNTKSKTKPTEEEIVKMRELGNKIKKIEEENALLEAEYDELLYKIPNLTHPNAPIGGENDYKVLEEYKRPPKFSFSGKTHEELMLDLDMVDFERGAKVTGSKFYFLKNDGVRLNQALINFGLDILASHGYVFVETPDLVKNSILDGSGFNPRGQESQIYEIKDSDLSLIGTAEITMLGFHANEVLDLSNGPKKYAALSHCFRTEAGAYGKTSKGLYRVHQFTKLEMFIFCRPEESDALHQELLEIEKEICKKLEFHYRVIDIPSGDLGGPAYRKYDIEAWMTMQGEGGGPARQSPDGPACKRLSEAMAGRSRHLAGGYGEITSASNCVDYQSRHLNIKYKKEDGATAFAHTLNGTAIVTSRFPLALIENHQQKDCSIKIPKTLRKYFGKKSIKKA